LAESQSFSPLHWAAFSNPFELIAFIVFVISGLVIMGVPPLDGGLSIPDIHGGVSSQVSGRRYILFRLGRFYGFFLWAIIAVVLFLGAWNLPSSLVSALEENFSWRTIQVLELSVLLIKTLSLMLVAVLGRICDASFALGSGNGSCLEGFEPVFVNGAHRNGVLDWLEGALVSGNLSSTIIQYLRVFTGRSFGDGFFSDRPPLFNER